jgi:hypothetical protein
LKDKLEAQKCCLGGVLDYESSDEEIAAEIAGQIREIIKIIKS